MGYNDEDLDVLNANEVQNTTKVKNRNKTPKMYSLLMHNSDIISFEYVLIVLSEIFQKDFQEAMDIAIIAHRQGKSLVGVYTKMQAEQKLRKLDKMNAEAVESGIIGEALIIEMKEN